MATNIQTRLPSFDRENIETWLFMVEQLFSVRETKPEMKFSILVSTLEPEMVEIAMSLAGTNVVKYEELVKILRKEYGRETIDDLNLLCDTSVSTMNPRGLLHKLKTKFKSQDEETIKALFIRKLPDEVRTYLEMAPDSTKIEDLAEMAHKGMRTGANKVSTVKERVQTEPPENKTSGGQGKIEELLEQLIERVTRLETTPQQERGPGPIWAVQGAGRTQVTTRQGTQMTYQGNNQGRDRGGRSDNYQRGGSRPYQDQSWGSPKQAGGEAKDGMYTAEGRPPPRMQERGRGISNQGDNGNQGHSDLPDRLIPFQGSDYCRYHQQFGFNAIRCEEPCKLKPAENR